MNNDFAIDISKFENLLEQIDFEKHKDELKSVIDEATQLLYNSAQGQLSSMVRQRGKNKYGLKLSDGIKRKTFTDGKAGAVWVSNTSNYIVYFHAKGTKQRTTKKGANRGQITAKPFLKNAVTSTQATIEEMLRSKIEEIITRKNTQ